MTPAEQHARLVPAVLEQHPLDLHLHVDERLDALAPRKRAQVEGPLLVLVELIRLAWRELGRLEIIALREGSRPARSRGLRGRN